MTRAEILDAAKGCVCKDRNEQYGAPEDNFLIIGNLWTAYLGQKIYPEDVAAMMILFKVGRIKTAQVPVADSWVDVAGYAACGGEIDTEDGNG